MKIYVCSHTHWDREWYAPFPSFHARLIAHVDYLLETLDNDPEFRVFNYDAQTVWIEDYLEFRPEKKNLLKKYISEGRISCGPWYVLPDEFLISGEALVRNLLRGRNIAEKFGYDSHVGYLCDMFGHSGQMPQILAGCGCDSAVVWRGISSATLPYDFIWEGYDGTQLLTHRIEEHIGYGYGVFSEWSVSSMLGIKPTKEELKDVNKKAEWLIAFAERLGERAASDVVYFSNGIDHIYPDRSVPVCLELARKKAPQHTIIHASFDEYIEALRNATKDKKLTVVKGDLRDVNRVPYGDKPTPANNLLYGVLSTRTDVKTKMYHVENILRQHVEPFVALACARGELDSASVAVGAIDHTWREILRCHPHDSSGCCSVDAVPRDMLARLATAEEYAHAARRAFLHTYCKDRDITLALTDGDVQDCIMLISAPHGGRATGVVSLPLPPGVSSDECSLKLCGIDADCVCEDATRYESGIVEPGIYDGGSRVAQFSVNCKDMPGTAVVHARITQDKNGVRRKWKTKDKVTLENEHIAFSISADGTIQLKDKTRDIVYKTVLTLEDTGDAGDTYSFSPPHTDTCIYEMEGMSLLADTDTPGVQRARLKAKMSVPHGLTTDLKARSEKYIELPLDFEFNVWDGIPRVDVSVTVKNTATNHRLRARIATGITTDVVWSDGHYTHKKRPAKPAEMPPQEAWIEDPPREAPHEEWCGVWNDSHGIVIRTYGLYEHEYLPEANGSLALTLMRCVGTLSKDEQVRRKNNVAPSVPTPEAQMQGEYTYSFSIIPVPGNTPQAFIQEQSARCVTHMCGYSVETLDKERTPDVYMKIHGARLAACKNADDHNGIILRLWNAVKDTADATVTLPDISVKTASAVRLDEKESEEESDIRFSGNTYDVSIPRNVIRTIRLT